MINSILIMLALYFAPTIIFMLLIYHRKIITMIYNFVRHKEVKFFVLSVAKFMVNIGASATSLVLIAFFIPQVGVTAFMLTQVGVSGTILAIAGYYIERFLK